VEFFQASIAVLSGVVLMHIVILRVVSWALIVVSAAEMDHSGRRSVISILVALVMSDGPWVLAAVAGLVFHFRESWWLYWSLGGAAFFLVWITVVSVRLIRQKKAEGSHAA
jgi:hypothetical protein